MRTFLSVCVISLYSALSWGQTSWQLSETMSATLNNGTLTFSTTASAEAMPDWEMTLEERDGGGYNMTVDVPWMGTDEYYDKIHSVVIGDRITTIGAWAFMGIINLTSVTIPNSITTIGVGTFWACTGLTSITMPNSITTIGEEAFYHCTSLESVIIPNSVTEIGKNAFAYCSSLETVTIPKSVTTMGDYVFVSCTALKTVTVEWATPLTVETIFYGNATSGYPDLSAATLRVPTGTKARYQAANVWKDFGTIVEYSPTGIEQVASQTLKAYASNGLLHITGLQSGQSLSIYNLAGQPVYQGIAKAAEEYVSLAVRGVYIVVTGDQTIKVIVN